MARGIKMICNKPFFRTNVEQGQSMIFIEYGETIEEGKFEDGKSWKMVNWIAIKVGGSKLVIEAGDEVTWYDEESDVMYSITVDGFLCYNGNIDIIPEYAEDEVGNSVGLGRVPLFEIKEVIEFLNDFKPVAM